MINFVLNYYFCLTKLTKSFKDGNKASSSVQLEAMFTLYMQLILWGNRFYLRPQVVS